jgi:hypothetical protein
MSIHFRGDPEPIRAIRPAAVHNGDGVVEVWLASDEPDDVPITVHRSRLVADGGAAEIDEAIAAGGR